MLTALISLAEGIGPGAAAILCVCDRSLQSLGQAVEDSVSERMGIEAATREGRLDASKSKIAIDNSYFYRIKYHFCIVIRVKLPMRASLFITCYNDTLFPETGRAVVSLLERLGVELDFKAKQTCCGQMHANTGFRGEAFSQAKRFVRLYQDAENVVIPSSSCVAMIRDQYPGLFEELGNETLRRDFAAMLPRVYELSEFLIDRLGVEDVGATFPHRVTYHASCHGVRALHLGDRPYRLLAKVRSLRIEPLENVDRCCGFGGTFSVKNAEVSSAMLAVKLQDVVATGAEYCTALDNSCLMHLGGAMHRQYAGMKTIHMAEILASTEASPAEATQ